MERPGIANSTETPQPDRPCEVCGQANGGIARLDNGFTHGGHPLHAPCPACIESAA